MELPVRYIVVSVYEKWSAVRENGVSLPTEMYTFICSCWKSCRRELRVRSIRKENHIYLITKGFYIQKFTIKFWQQLNVIYSFQNYWCVEIPYIVHYQDDWHLIKFCENYVDLYIYKYIYVWIRISLNFLDFILLPKEISEFIQFYFQQALSISINWFYI